MMQSTQLPRSLETAELLISCPPPPEADADIQRLFSDSEALKYLPTLQKPNGWSLREIVARREFQTRSMEEGTNWSGAVYEKQTGTFVGVCGYRSLDLTAGIGEFGIILDGPFRRRGFSAQIHLLFLEYSFDVLHLKRVIFRTHPNNVPMRSFFQRYAISYDSMVKVDDVNEFAQYILNADDWPRSRTLLKAHGKL
jgi:RimJ/RimL family protein N-acetyltransferase